jgi:hypothetical protein
VSASSAYCCSLTHWSSPTSYTPAIVVALFASLVGVRIMNVRNVLSRVAKLSGTCTVSDSRSKNSESDSDNDIAMSPIVSPRTNNRLDHVLGSHDSTIVDIHNSMPPFDVSLFEQTTGLNPTDIVDLMCLCGLFESPLNGWEPTLSHRSERAEFRYRPQMFFQLQRWWQPRENRWEIRLPSGLHMRLFIRDDILVVVFRHQDGESILDKDMNMAMAMWGRNFIELTNGKQARTGSGISTMADLVQQGVFTSRRLVFGTYLHDYMKQIHPRLQQ